MSALKIHEQIALVFTTVLDELSRGLVEEDEEVQAVTDRTYWEQRGTKQTVAMADELLELVRSLDSSLEFKYNKFYIGLAKDGQPNNFVIFRPKKNQLNMEIRLREENDLKQQMEAAGLDLMDYDKRWGRYRIRLAKADISARRELIMRLLKMAYDNEAID